MLFSQHSYTDLYRMSALSHISLDYTFHVYPCISLNGRVDEGLECSSVVCKIDGSKCTLGHSLDIRLLSPSS